MSHAPSAALRQRHDQIRRALTAASLDALVVTALPNITYLTNFTGSTAIVVVTPGAIVFLTDSRYTTSLAETRGTPSECPDLETVVVEGSYDVTLARILGEQGFAHVGVEAANLTLSRFQWLEGRLRDEASALALTPTEGIVETGRVVKDDYEIQVFREAGRRLADATLKVLGDVRAGLTEREMSVVIEGRLREAGFERPAFETIVASGPRAALPHARPTERKLSEGDLVVLDFGGVYDSYCVDLTRTVAIGKASPRSREVYEAVLVAHDRAVAAGGPGRSRFDVDAAARDWLTQAGMGEAFGHGTGHGLGIEIHEDPRIGKRRPDVDTTRELLEPGMVFTIEPGAYFPGWAGVRIEDDVLVTATGVDLLTSVTTELLEIY